MTQCSAHNRWHYFRFRMNTFSSTFFCDTVISLVDLRSTLICFKDIVEPEAILSIYHSVCWSSFLPLCLFFCWSIQTFSHCILCTRLHLTSKLMVISPISQSQLFFTSHSVCERTDWKTAHGRTYLYEPNSKTNDALDIDQSRWPTKCNLRLITHRFIANLWHDGKAACVSA